MASAGPSFRLATWNILATSYIRPKFYPNSPPGVLDPEWRIPAIVQSLRTSDRASAGLH